MSFDGRTSHAVSESNSKPKPVGLRSFTQEALSLGIIAVCASLSWLLVDVKTALVKHNELTGQQIIVTRSMHNVQELATAYMENRRASEAAEKAGVPPAPKDDLKSQIEFLR